MGKLDIWYNLFQWLINIRQYSEYNDFIIIAT